MMQFAQFLNWLTILPLSEYGTCTVYNKYATYFAYFALSIQPIFNLISVILYEPKERVNLYIIPFIFAIITSILWIIQLFLGELGYVGESSVIVNKLVSDTHVSVYSTITCTYVGKYNCILWNFKLYLAPLLPTHYTYIILGIPLLFISDLRQRFILVYGHFILALYSSYYYRDSAEFTSYWCASTVSLPILFLADMLYDNYRLRRMKYLKV